MITGYTCRCGNIESVTLHEFYDVHSCSACGSFAIIRIEECCRKPFLIVVKHQYNHHLYVIRRQCKTCGGCLDMKRPLPSKKYGDAIRGEFDQDCFEDWKQNVSAEHTMLYKIKQSLDLQNTKYYKYQTYLSSDEWRAKRLLVLGREHNICQECKIKPAEDIHHITYKRLFNEPLDDLMAVCKECHGKIHNTNH